LNSNSLLQSFNSKLTQLVMLKSIAIIAFLFLAQTQAEYIHDPFILGLFQNVSQLEHTIQKIESEFDLVRKTSGSISQPAHLTRLLTLLPEIKSAKNQIYSIQEQISANMETDHLAYFLERILVNWVDIELRSHEEALNSIGFEILAYNDGLISGFVERQYSETLRTVLDVLDIKYDGLQSDLEAVDKLVKQEFALESNHSGLAAGMKNRLNMDLELIANHVDEFRTQLSKDFYVETERVRYEHKALDRIQNMKVNRFVDALYFTGQFLQNYRQVINRLPWICEFTKFKYAYLNKHY